MINERMMKYGCANFLGLLLPLPSVTNLTKSECVTNISVTPSIADFNINLITASSGVTRFWLSGVTATSFDINLDTTPTASASFALSVDSEGAIKRLGIPIED